MTVKVKFALEQATKTQRASRGIALLFLNLSIEGGGWSKPRSGFFALGNNLVPIVEEPGWAHPAVDTVGKKHTKIAVLSSWSKLIHYSTR